MDNYLPIKFIVIIIIIIIDNKSKKIQENVEFIQNLIFKKKCFPLIFQYFKLKKKSSCSFILIQNWRTSIELFHQPEQS